MEHKIGVLFPQSNAHPQIAKSYVNGLRLGLGKLTYKLFIESIGLGSDPKQIINSLQKLTVQENVALTTGLLGHYGFKEIAEYVSNNDEILLAANFGTNFPLKLPEGVFQNTLDLQNSLITLVDYFSKNKINNIATSSSFYESGYGFIKGLEMGINNTKNNQFVGHFITPHQPRENESELMRLFMKETKPDAIIALYSGIFAEEHLAFLKKNNIHKEYPIYALPFSSEEKLVEESPEIFKNIKTVSSWYKDLKNESNKMFTESYQEAYAKSPDFFSLLGYENGLVIKNALSQKKQPVKKAIQETAINGPRGAINFDSIFKKTNFSYCIWNQHINAENEVVREPIEELPLNNSINLTTITEKERINQGWFNAYLCY